jgi:hypothetical protein
VDDDQRRCRRIGYGNPPLCRHHRIVIEAELEADDPLDDLLGDVDRWISQKRGPEADLLQGLMSVLGTVVLPRILHSQQQAAYQRARMAGARARRRHPGREIPFPPPPPPPPPFDWQPPPAPDPVRQGLVKARQVLNFEPNEALTAEAINKRRRELARVYHPDRPNGSKEAMQRINEAADDLLANLA